MTGAVGFDQTARELAAMVFDEETDAVARSREERADQAVLSLKLDMISEVCTGGGGPAELEEVKATAGQLDEVVGDWFAGGGRTARICSVSDLRVQILEICRDVHRELGPYHRETVYRKALQLALASKGVKAVHGEVSASVCFRGHEITSRRCDILVRTRNGDRAIVEVKALSPNSAASVGVHDQLRHYLHLFEIPEGFAVVFPRLGAFPPSTTGADYTTTHLGGMKIARRRRRRRQPRACGMTPGPGVDHVRGTATRRLE